ncbi:MAG: hypothetical protein JNL94_19990, partial [Planctomycetes bacterium]|nr:hypothetical protein [Planctomycetota bacterium]
MARHVARLDRTTSRFGVGVGLALITASLLAAISIPSRAIASTQDPPAESPLTTYRTLIARIESGAPIDVSVVKELGSAARALFQVEGPERLDSDRLVEILDRTTNEVLRAGHADGASFFAALLVEELIRAGRAADAEGVAGDRIRALESKRAKSTPFALTKLHRAHRLCGDFERLDGIGARCEALLVPLAECAEGDLWTRAQWFGLYEERVHLAEDLGLPDRMRYWTEQARAAATGLDEGRYATNHRNLRLMEIDAATAAGDQAAAFDAIDRAEAAGDPPAPLAFRRAMASTRAGSDERAWGRPALIDALRRAIEDDGLLAENRARARVQLAGLLLADGAYDDVARLTADLSDPGLGPRIRALELLGFRVEAMLHSDATAQELADATAELRSALLDRIASFGRVSALAAGSGPLYFPTVRAAYASWIESTLRADPEHGAERAVELLLAGQEAGLFARRVDARCGSVADIRARVLHRDEGLVLFLPSSRRTGHVFAIDAEGLVHAPLPESSELADASAALFEHCCSRPARSSDDAVSAAHARAVATRQRALGSALFPDPIARRLATWRRLVVCGADVLGTVPYEACIVGDRALGRSHALRVVASLPVAAHVAARPRRDVTRGGLVFAATAPNASFAAQDPRVLPIDVEPERLVAIARSLDAELVSGDAATADALRAFDG